MSATAFDFDVITGPSVPRDSREQPKETDHSPSRPAGSTQPASPRTR